MNAKSSVMAGLDPAFYVLDAEEIKKDVDARVKPGRDDVGGLATPVPLENR